MCLPERRKDFKCRTSDWKKHYHYNLKTKESQAELAVRLTFNIMSFPDDSVGKEAACNVEDSSSIPGSGRSPGEGNGNPLHYSCLDKAMDRGAWWATVRGLTKTRT